MKYILIVTSIFLTFASKAQDFNYATNEYDKKIFLYQIKQVENKKIDKTSYLENSKPFSKWDSRPLNDSLVWVMNQVRTASIIPNFFWGSFANHYGLSQKEALELPNTFLKNAYTQEKTQIQYFKKNEAIFEELTSLLLKSNKLIFLKQKDLERVDDLFYENKKYWKYIIAQDSPFPISDSTTANVSNEFSASDESILKMMEKLDIYAIYNNSGVIFFLRDGILDNSYGFVYQKNDTYIKSNHLFNISLKTEIKSKYYYYIAK